MGSHPLSRVVDKLRGAVSGDARDDELLDQFVAQRDENAFARLVERHGPLVLGVCRQVLRDFHAADDVFQATFLVLARKAGSLRRESLGGWLYRTATNLALTARTSAQRRRSHDVRDRLVRRTCVARSRPSLQPWR